MTSTEKSDMLFFKSQYIELERKYRELLDAVCSRRDPIRNDHAAVVRGARILKAYYDKDYGSDEEATDAVNYLHAIDVENEQERK